MLQKKNTTLTRASTRTLIIFKTWYACDVQATLCRAIRGDVYSLLPRLDSQQTHNCHSTLTSPSQGRAPGVSGLNMYNSTYSKWQLRTRVGNPCTPTLTQIKADIHKRTHVDTIIYPQTNLSSQLWMLLLMLLISISPNSCNGACTSTHARSRLCLSSP